MIWKLKLDLSMVKMYHHTKKWSFYVNSFKSYSLNWHRQTDRTHTHTHTMKTLPILHTSEVTTVQPMITKTNSKVLLWQLLVWVHGQIWGCTMYAPLLFLILSFRHTHFAKHGWIGSWHPPPPRDAPPMGNTGSSTVVKHWQIQKSIFITQHLCTWVNM